MVVKKIKSSSDVDDNLKLVFPNLEKAIKGLDLKTAEILFYWLDTWSSRYLPNERSYDYSKHIGYKRGSVVQANFGFKVGSEQGGLHYALVVENNNLKSNHTVMVVPLSSLPDEKDPKTIGDNEVFLGYSLFKEDIKKTEDQIEKDEKRLDILKEKGENTDKLQRKIIRNKKKLVDWNKGTVALVNQMCALDKMRIYTPKFSSDDLSNFKLGTEEQQLIDAKIKELYLGS